jgi:hypothetical protein
MTDQQAPAPTLPNGTALADLSGVQALSAMLKGRTTTGYNPADAKRAAALIAASKRHKRPTRPQRPKRPAR